MFRDPLFTKDPFLNGTQLREVSVYSYEEGLAILKDPTIHIADHSVLLDNEVLAAIKEPKLVAELVKQQLLLGEHVVYRTKVVNNYGLMEIKIPHNHTKTTTHVITGRRQSGKTTHALDTALDVNKQNDLPNRKQILYVGSHVNSVEATGLCFERMRFDVEGVDQIRYLTIKELKKRMTDSPNRVLSDYAVVIFDNFEIMDSSAYNRLEVHAGTVKLTTAISNVVPTTIYVLN